MNFELVMCDGDCGCRLVLLWHTPHAKWRSSLTELCMGYSALVETFVMYKG